MGISAVYGLPGKGKTSFQVYYGLFLANKYQKKLVSNFAFNPVGLAKYCKLMNYRWLFDNLEKGIVYYISCDDSLESIMSIKDSVVLLDEGAIYLPARGSAYTTPKQLLKDFCQVRHDSQYLIYSAQNERQVDVALRNLTEEVFWANGTSVWDDKLRNEKLIAKTIRRFTTDTFEQFMGDAKLRKNPIKVKILANKSWTGLLSCADKYVFQLYSSFARLEGKQVLVKNNYLYLSYKCDQVASEPISSDRFVSAVSSSSSVSIDELLKTNTTSASAPSFPCIKGKNPLKFHPYSKLVSLLFTKLPAACLPFVLELDNKLSKAASFNLSSFEKKVLKYGFFYLVSLFLLGIIL